MKWWLASLVIVLAGGATGAERSLPDYRYFRALSIDLAGRPPTRAELGAFENPSFDLQKWIDAQLSGPAYAERVRRIYTDLLRLELAEDAAVFRPPAVLLRWTTIQDADGKTLDLYFREGQRRVKPELDGQVCFSPLETGLTVGADGPPNGVPKRVSKRLLDERTVVVKPWWLYADYRSKQPRDRADASWVEKFGYELAWKMFNEPNGTPTTGVRVCREEAQTADTGRVYTTGRIVKKGDALLPGRTTRLPADTAFATANAGKRTTCVAATGYESSVECGCGVGLERCMPTYPGGFVMPWLTPLGVDAAFDSAPRPAILWLRAWLSQEAVHFLDRIFREDRDVREILTSPGTVINGPLAQFYRFLANTTCCGPAADLGYNQPEPLFDPAKVPTSLAPHEVAMWTDVPDRGPHAAGVMTMPMFLLKYGSRRQRAHVIYNAFMCKEFVAETVKLEPSTEPDLTKRAGCATCHSRLEPMAAYFARIQESDWTYFPKSVLPVSLDRCTAAGPAGMPMGACRTFYDPDFTTRSTTMLRGAYGSPAHADEGPRGFAREVTSSPEFAPCVVRNVAQSLLGRTLTVEDDAWKAAMAKGFVDGGYRMRSLVRAIVTSPLYRDANDRKAVR